MEKFETQLKKGGDCMRIRKEIHKLFYTSIEWSEIILPQPRHHKLIPLHWSLQRSFQKNQTSLAEFIKTCRIKAHWRYSNDLRVLLKSLFNPGKVTEWPKVRDWKSRVRATVPGVRIPPFPPAHDWLTPPKIKECIWTYWFL